ncbi:MAG: hypothetical protein IT163_11350 [Bryobacterales bacterium]|nr:hypothetical protein [Bryobacterales bacterium]
MNPAAPTPWHHVLARLLFALFLCELGLFLIIYPWLDVWATNRFATFGGDTLASANFAGLWRRMWISPYFRGAISGLGFVNIYISLLEVFSMRRRHIPDDEESSGPDEAHGDSIE